LHTASCPVQQVILRLCPRALQSSCGSGVIILWFVAALIIRDERIDAGLLAIVPYPIILAINQCRRRLSTSCPILALSDRARDLSPWSLSGVPGRGRQRRIPRQRAFHLVWPRKERQGKGSGMRKTTRACAGGSAHRKSIASARPRRRHTDTLAVVLEVVRAVRSVVCRAAHVWWNMHEKVKFLVRIGPSSGATSSQSCYALG
jgi:hypothetical protein